MLELNEAFDQLAIPQRRKWLILKTAKISVIRVPNLGQKTFHDELLIDLGKTPLKSRITLAELVNLTARGGAVNDSFEFLLP